MRIAFTSCFSADIVRQQAVWDEIARTAPDVLVLLGDSIYMDCSLGQTTESVRGMTTSAFAQHMRQLYVMQLQQAGFSKLVQDQRIRKFAVWDDHDFLWNDASGADVAEAPQLREFVAPSRFYFQAFRKLLASHGASGFPGPAAWDTTTPAPLYGAPEKLAPDVLLHLLDCRSQRSRRRERLIGDAQLAALVAAVPQSPEAIHLIASSTTFESNRGESWAMAPREYGALARLAQNHDLLMLSGDIHKTVFTAHNAPGSGRKLYEATASGAGIRGLVTLGSELRNFGLVDIDDNYVTVRLSQSGVRDDRKPIARATWIQAP